MYGTQTGNAEALSIDMASVLEEANHKVELYDMADLYPERLLEYPRIMVCTSTWGEGDLPNNALDLFEALAEVSPDLHGHCYGVIALGDRDHQPHYCAGGHRFDQLLETLGAQRIKAVLEIDAGPTTQDYEQAARWILDCVEQMHAKS